MTGEASYEARWGAMLAALKQPAQLELDFSVKAQVKRRSGPRKAPKPALEQHPSEHPDWPRWGSPEWAPVMEPTRLTWLLAGGERSSRDGVGEYASDDHASAEQRFHSAIKVHP